MNNIIITETHRLFDIDTALRIMDYISEGYTKDEAIALATEDEAESR